MLVVLKANLSAADREATARALAEIAHGNRVTPFLDATPPVVVVRGDDNVRARVQGLDAVAEIRAEAPYLATRAGHPENRTVRLDDVVIGGKDVVLIAGPCSTETYEQTLAAALAAKKAGARLLRGGAFKPRTSPYSFQGHGEEGLRQLARVAAETGLKVVTEVVSPEDVPLVAEHAHMLQIGARNMQNFALLKAVSRSARPVLLKRGFGCTVDELLASAEYILAGGNPDVVLCERGIRTFEGSSRFTFDLNGLAYLKAFSSLPVIADPSHATGNPTLIPAVTRAAVAAGADGVMLEVHPEPDHALSDGDQALTPDAFSTLMREVRAVAEAVGRAF